MTRDRKISRSLQEICKNEFPDNEENSWQQLKTLHDGDRMYSLIEMEPKDVGYDRFVFVFRFNHLDTEFVTLAIYCLEGERYYLLATTPDCDEPFPRILIW